MVSATFGLFAASHAVLCAALLGAARKQRSWCLLFAGVVAAGLVYDNGIVALGAAIGEGALLEGLNYPRFVVHALFTPLLVITAVGLARRSGAPWAQGRGVHAAFCAVAAALVAYGIGFEVAGLELVPQTEGDALRYSGAEAAPPVPAAAAILIVIGVGLALVRRGGLALLLGAAAMFAAAAAPSAPMALANLGEVALIAGFAITGTRRPPAAALRSAPG
ncbi:hypothetical protein [Nocardiopsis coralliicola]